MIYLRLNEALLSGGFASSSTKIGNSKDTIFADVNFIYAPHISLQILYKSFIVFGMAIKDK